MRGRQSPSWAMRLRPQSTWQHPPSRNNDMRISCFHQHCKVHDTVGQSMLRWVCSSFGTILTRECLCHITCRAVDWLGRRGGAHKWAPTAVWLATSPTNRAAGDQERQKPRKCSHWAAHICILRTCPTSAGRNTGLSLVENHQLTTRQALHWSALGCSHEGHPRGDTTLYQLLLQSSAARTVTCLGPKKAKS